MIISSLFSETEIRLVQQTAPLMDCVSKLCPSLSWSELHPSVLVSSCCFQLVRHDEAHGTNPTFIKCFETNAIIKNKKYLFCSYFALPIKRYLFLVSKEHFEYNYIIPSWPGNLIFFHPLPMKLDPPLSSCLGPPEINTETEYVAWHSCELHPRFRFRLPISEKHKNMIRGYSGPN